MEWGWPIGPIGDPSDDWGEMQTSWGQTSSQLGETNVARMAGSRYTVILWVNENVPLVWKFIIPNVFLKITDYNLKVGWITTSAIVKNAYYLFHYDIVLQIQARWITFKHHFHDLTEWPIKPSVNHVWTFWGLTSRDWVGLGLGW
jgi:hypothetical protein